MSNTRSLPSHYTAPFSSALARTVSAADVLAFHRVAFGDARMEGDPAGGGDPAPVPSPPPSRPATDAVDYPADTPVSEMTPEQRIAYDKAKREENAAKRREWREATGGRSAAEVRADLEELDRLRKAAETDVEKAVREAREEGAAAARSEEFSATALAVLRTGLRYHGLEDESAINDIVESANLAAFKAADGSLDDDKIARFVARNAGTASTTWPDTGGNKGGDASPKPGQSGAAEADRRFGPKDKS